MGGVRERGREGFCVIIGLFGGAIGDSDEGFLCA